MFRWARMPSRIWRWRMRSRWCPGLVSVSSNGAERAETGKRFYPVASWSPREAGGYMSPGLNAKLCSWHLDHMSILLCFNSDVVALACEDRTLSVFSACGRRLIPSIMLPAPISALHCSGHFVMVLMASATLSVWYEHYLFFAKGDSNRINYFLWNR